MKFLQNIALLALMTLPNLSLADVVCPLGKKEDHLTIHRVMLNFGKYTMDADSIALKDVTPQQDVTETQITTAIEKLKLAQACADAVIANPMGDMLPDAADGLPPVQRQKLIDDLLMFMQEFSDGLIDYQDALTQVLNTPVASRNYHQVYVICGSLNDLVTRAHRETSFDSDPNANSFIGMDKDNSTGDVKDLMKQIGTIFSAIKKTASNAANNATNAQGAKQMVALFGQVVTQAPPSIQNLPADQRATATADFKKMIQQEIDLSTQLAAAFDKNDNSTAVALVQQMNSLKMDGHGKYDP